MIKERLPEAVQQCIHAAAREHAIGTLRSDDGDGDGYGNATKAIGLD